MQETWLLFVAVLLHVAFPLGAEQDLRTLRRNLLKDYDRQARPVKFASTTTVVEVKLTPIYLVAIDEDKQEMVLQVWLYMGWKDEYLRWQPANAQNIEIVPFGADEIWKPDLAIYNGVHDSEWKEMLILAFSNGSVIYVPAITVRSKCSLRHEHYPLDSHQCNVTIGSWTQDNSKVSLNFFQNIFSEDELKNDNPLWDIKEITAERELKYYNCCAEPYSSVTYTFHLVRRPPPAWSRIWGPSVALSLVTLLMFWVPPSRPQVKLALGCTATIALSVLVAQDLSSTHSHSLVFPTMLTVGIAAVVEVAVVILGALTGPAPALVVKLASSTVGKLLWITSSVDAGSGEKSEWSLVAQFIDRLMFLIFLVAIIAQQATH